MPKSAKGASRTLTEAVKSLKGDTEGLFTPDDLQRARAVILANLEATRSVGTARSGFKEIPDDATRQRAAEIVFKLGLHEVTRSESQTEAQTEEDDSGPKQATALPPIPPALEKRILQDRLAALGQNQPESARS